MEKIKLKIPVIVEGKYDKIKLSSVVDAVIITTEGFGVFKNKERLALIKRLGEGGIAVLTDSDGAGGVIRSHISSALPKDKIYNLYIPRREGKEKRKERPSAEGVLGVEGIDGETLREIFADFARRHPSVLADGAVESGFAEAEPITKTDFYVCGLTGGPESRDRRNKLGEALCLPPDMTANALLSAANMLMTREEFFAFSASEKD